MHRLRIKYDYLKIFEYELKSQLVEAIKNEFDTYNKDKVILIPEYDDNPELYWECYDLQDTRLGVRLQTRISGLYGFARSKYIKKDRFNKLNVYCEFELNLNSDDLESRLIYPGHEYFTFLEGIYSELSVSDLWGLLEILQNPIIKQINQ